MKRTFKVYYEEWQGEDCPDEIEAADHEDAAEIWAESKDSEGDYTIIGGDSVSVRVESIDGVSKVLRVHGETVARYHADEVRKDES